MALGVPVKELEAENEKLKPHRILRVARGLTANRGTCGKGKSHGTPLRHAHRCLDLLNDRAPLHGRHNLCPMRSFST